MKKITSKILPRRGASSSPSNPTVTNQTSDDDATIDIFFVHGRPAANKSLLPNKLWKARLLTYGYDAYVMRSSTASKNVLADHAAKLLSDLTADRMNYDGPPRKIIFVAHSLCGPVCKADVLRSRNHPEPHLRGVFDNVVGIIFMGTPHKGSWMAGWGRSLLVPWVCSSP